MKNANYKNKWRWTAIDEYLRQYRIKKALPIIQLYKDCRVLDIGCGIDASFLRYIEPYIKSGVGIDMKIRAIDTGKIRTIATVLDGNLPFEDKSYEVVSMLAVLEHLENPLPLINDIERVLVDDGSLILTVPHPSSKFLLETLARLKIINAQEVFDHKKYYDYIDIEELLRDTKLKIYKHFYFQLGMNNFAVIKKK